MKRLYRLLGLVGVGMLVVVGIPRAEASSYDAAQSAASVAQEEMAAGRWGDASRRLSEALRRCPEGSEGRGCRLLIQFNLGYLYERWSRVPAERERAYLERSAALYGRVLEEAPTHAETVTNLSLVLQGLGDTRGLQALKQRLRAVDPARSAAVSEILGDSYAARENWRSAFDAYLEAAALEPADEAPGRQAIHVYRRAGGAIGSAALFRWLNTWEARYPEAAASGYGAIVEQLGNGDITIAESALLRWLAIVSDQRIVSSALVARQFAGVRLREVRQLERFLKTLEELETGQAPDLRSGLTSYSGDECGAGDWWLASPRRRDVLAQAALALGRAAVVAREPARAEAVLTLAALCAPPSEEYVFGEMSEAAFTPLDIVTELAWLEFRFSELDPRGEKLAAVIEQLFVGKAMAYEARDLEAIQRHHVVLGQIYAARGEWEGSGYRNATFQLSNAVRVARQRELEGGYYEPMPGIKALLGETYEKTGKASAAQDVYVDAAQAYLDSDDLERSGALLARAKSVAPIDQASSIATKLRATEQILDTRRAVELRPGDQSSGATRPSTSPESGWLHGDAVVGLSADFLSRQRFKVNADLALVATNERASEAAERYAKAALQSASAVNALVGAGDVLRLERVGSLADATPTKAETKVDIIYGESVATEEPAWRVKLPSAKEPAQVRLKE